MGRASGGERWQGDPGERGGPRGTGGDGSARARADARRWRARRARGRCTPAWRLLVAELSRGTTDGAESSPNNHQPPRVVAQVRASAAAGVHVA